MLHAWWRSSKYYFIVFGLTRTELEPIIHHIQSKQANHNTTDAVSR